MRTINLSGEISLPTPWQTWHVATNAPLQTAQYELFSIYAPAAENVKVAPNLGAISRFAPACGKRYIFRAKPLFAAGGVYSCP